MTPGEPADGGEERRFAGRQRPAPVLLRSGRASDEGGIIRRRQERSSCWINILSPQPGDAFISSEPPFRRLVPQL